MFTVLLVKPAEMQPHSYKYASYLSYMLKIIGIIGKVTWQKVTLKHRSLCDVMHNVKNMCNN